MCLYGSDILRGGVNAGVASADECCTRTRVVILVANTVGIVVMVWCSY